MGKQFFKFKTAQIPWFKVLKSYKFAQFMDISS